MQRLIGFTLAMILLASFFLPWSKFVMIPGSGYELALHPQLDFEPLFILPILCGILICSFAFKKYNNSALMILTGLAPVIGTLAGLIYGSQRLNVSIAELWPNVSPFIDWGVYVTLVTGALLFFCGFLGWKRRV